MNIEEYNKVKDLKYYEYVDYLQNKYGKPSKPYFKLDDDLNWVCDPVSGSLLLGRRSTSETIAGASRC